jgi:hypothetical protein
MLFRGSRAPISGGNFIVSVRTPTHARLRLCNRDLLSTIDEVKSPEPVLVLFLASYFRAISLPSGFRTDIVEQ